MNDIVGSIYEFIGEFSQGFRAVSSSLKILSEFKSI